MIWGRGRPLRFLLLIGFGWIGLRAAMLWPVLDPPAGKSRAFGSPSVDSVVEMIREIAPVTIGAAPDWSPLRRTVAILRSPRQRRLETTKRIMQSTPSSPATIVMATAVQRQDSLPAAIVPLLPGLPQALAEPGAPSRWSGSAWLVARGGAGIAPGALGGQLGGSQAGVRLAYVLDRKHRLGMVARATSPLGSGLVEASLGAEWQPTALPVRIVVERRFAIAGGKGGPAAGVVGGFGPLGIPLGFRIEGYGQAGVIRRIATEAYIDGALRTAHSIAAIRQVRVELGAGIWGGAQRGAARIDLGPSLGVIVPIERQQIRLALDWRQRVAGGAHPGSGAALTLGADF